MAGSLCGEGDDMRMLELLKDGTSNTNWNADRMADSNQTAKAVHSPDTQAEVSPLPPVGGVAQEAPGGDAAKRGNV